MLSFCNLILLVSFAIRSGFLTSGGTGDGDVYGRFKQWNIDIILNNYGTSGTDGVREEIGYRGALPQKNYFCVLQAAKLSPSTNLLLVAIDEL